MLNVVTLDLQVPLPKVANPIGVGLTTSFRTNDRTLKVIFDCAFNTDGAFVVLSALSRVSDLVDRCLQEPSIAGLLKSNLNSEDKTALVEPLIDQLADLIVRWRKNDTNNESAFAKVRDLTSDDIRILAILLLDGMPPFDAVVSVESPDSSSPSAEWLSRLGSLLSYALAPLSIGERFSLHLVSQSVPISEGTRPFISRSSTFLLSPLRSM